MCSRKNWDGSIFMISRRKLIVGIVAGLSVVGISVFSYIKLNELPPGLYAEFNTSEGTFVCKLFPEKASHTVDNFVKLSEGTKEWRDPRDNQIVKKPFYDGLTFHRVVKGFMIQGGDPMASGQGGPGYFFKDEFADDLDFSKPGVLAMANHGFNTNGSQFFVTLGPATHLNHKHTIFGEVVKGMDTVEKIGNIPTPGGDAPSRRVFMNSVKILRIQ